MRQFITLCGYAFIFGISLLISSCMALTRVGKMDVEVPLTVTTTSVPQTFRDLDKPVRLDVRSQADPAVVKSELPSRKAMLFARNYIFSPSLKVFGEDVARDYLQRMRFDVSASADYTLTIDIRKLNVTLFDNAKSKEVTAIAKCELVYKLTDESGSNLLASSTVASTVTLSQTEVFGAGMGRAYVDALSKIDWSRIAGFLKVGNTAKQEKNAQVKGDGDTALERTVIRWNIISSPQGADVSWRVISSTPEVSNTNANYVGSTPYESTESFDIRGLTYNNSGNVQIEITCERSGYLPQKKRFNLRQAIDQKEISAKFNLIKDE
ncbi:MAG: hypothetical protein K2I26_07020 [Paramuribaculum sp.]|nr:hypothetical protein [Paramuribaculum sp.]